MATGDQSDIQQRLRSALPAGWFPSPAPVLDALLSGFAAPFVHIFDMLTFVRAQTRIGTATGIWLDGIAADFFTALSRGPGQSDTALRTRILAEIVRPRATRAAVIGVLQTLTGRTPTVFEPRNPSDTGGYNVGGVGYNVAGGYGNLQLPFQFFVTAGRPAIAGNISGGGYGVAIGYAVGGGQYLQQSAVTGGISDLDIYAAISRVLPVATTAWTQITA